MAQSLSTVLDVAGLTTVYHSAAGPVRAVDDVSWSVGAGETLCIVGESGCGKSATAMSVMRLIPASAGRIVAGGVRLAGHGDLLGLSERRMADVRGAAISMVFQEPMASLNPLMRVGRQIDECILRHEPIGRRAARERTVALLEKVRFADPMRVVNSYPHELSGGMRQRVMIAMAVSCNPRIIIADEPTTALDVTTQAFVLDILADLKRELGAAIVLITHDLGVVRQVAQRVCVMYAGAVVEEGRADEVLGDPRHPYTRALMKSVPGGRRYARGARLPTIGGTVPNLAALPVGCRFQDRCPDVFARCRSAEPPLFDGEAGAASHRARCWLAAPAPVAGGVPA